MATSMSRAISPSRISPINGGIIYVAGEIVDNDGNWHGTGDISRGSSTKRQPISSLKAGLSTRTPTGTFVAQATVVDVDEGDTHSYEWSTTPTADSRSMTTEESRSPTAPISITKQPMNIQ